MGETVEGQNVHVVTAAEEAAGEVVLTIPINENSRLKVSSVSVYDDSDPWKEALIAYRRTQRGLYVPFYNDRMAPRHQVIWQGELYLARLNALIVYVWDPSDGDSVQYAWSYEVL